MTNYVIYNADINSKKIIRKISYNCSAADAVWTGSKKGVGVISYDPYTTKVTFNKLWGTNPYWWQLLAAAISIVPPEDYTRERNRIYPFKVSIKEGYSGCLHVHLDEYYRSESLGKYVLDGKGECLDISVGEKIHDGLCIGFGDLVEMGRKLCQYFDMGWSRNPRWWKHGSKDFWRFERLRNFEVTDEVDFDPNLK
jgi:hypothetical protein